MNTEHDIEVDEFKVCFFTAEIDESYYDEFGLVESKYIDLDDTQSIRIYDSNDKDLKFENWSVRDRLSVIDAIHDYIYDLQHSSNKKRSR